jgi:23S rRNA (guanosine2251-2'-O)-methyltransferase
VTPPRGGKPGGKPGAKSGGKSAGKASSRGAAPGGRKATAKRAGSPGRTAAPKRGSAPKAASPLKDTGKSRKPMSAAAKKAVEAKQVRHAAASVRKADRPGAPRRSRGEGDRPVPHGQSAPRGIGGDQIEGRQAVRELLLAGKRRVREVMVAEQQDNNDVLEDIVDLAQDMKIPVREVTRTKLFSQARTESPQGVVARADELIDHDLLELAKRKGPNGSLPFLLAMDGVTDPGNLGALLRTAECAGVTGVVLPRHRAVHITPTVTKSAAGAIEYLPMCLVGGLPNAISDLRAAGVWVIGLDMGGDTDLFDLRVADEPVCLVMGAEGRGLSRLVRERCDAVASIPLVGELASLNVSAAGALACYEVTRRRLAAKSQD